MDKPNSHAQFQKNTLESMARATRLAASIFSSITVNKHDAKHNVACLLCASIIDGCRSVVCLLESRLYHAIPKVLRHIMEKSVDLINLESVEEYLECIVLHSTHSESKIMDRILECSEEPYVDKQIESIDKKFSDLF